MFLLSSYFLFLLFVCFCVQKELFQRQAEVQRRIQGTEQKLKELPPLARQQKVK